MRIPEKGFTILEITVSMFLFTFVIILVGSSFIIAQKAYNKGATENELTQNIRVCLDRITREVRQSVQIITLLPAVATDPENPPSNEIIFQDGHNISQITYLRYYIDGSNIKRKHYAFYFDDDPAVYVTHNSTDAYGNPPSEISLSDDIIGEYAEDMKFWGTDGHIFLSLSLTKNQKTIKIDTSIYSRNE
ncbi:MAG: type II secretion system protein [Patescibacteria group bacterium]|jgi:type II secretory pathway pseudopilin PulG